MEATDRPSLGQEDQLELISKLFGSYKAEWLNDTLFDLYSEPSYFPEILTPRPCVLSGGRGTGKTTVLRSLSYEGQWELLKRTKHNITDSKQAFASLAYYGFYYRVNTTRVTAFTSPLLENSEWQKLFLHYFNILFVQKIIKFLSWYQLEINPNFLLDEDFLEDLCLVMSIPLCSSLEDAEKKLHRSLISIESYINNLGIDEKPKLNTHGALESILTSLGNLVEFKGKTFFLIIDEYENFRDEQQQVINSLIKHTNASYTFKIGVRKLGWRVRNTLNPNENLTSPADYVLIDIASKLGEHEFSEFAKKVCNSRIEKLFQAADGGSSPSVMEMFPALSVDEEAERLGVSEAVFDLRESFEQNGDHDLKIHVRNLTNLELYVMRHWAEGQKLIPLDVIKSSINEMDKWIPRIQEYQFAYLFTLRARRKGLRKYYCGWDTLSKLSGVNIRYLLELVEQSLLLHYKNNQTFEGPVSPEIQTHAALLAGQKNLQELDGLSVYGAKLTKLVLGLGRIFGTLAEDPAGHAHEVNQFRLKHSNILESIADDKWIITKPSPSSELLSAAVMHQALLTFPGNKPKTEGDLKDDTFLLHPIFAPYFVFSQRKRRNLILQEDDIIGLIDAPSKTITKILVENNRDPSAELPEQLQLFHSYYSK